MDPVTQTPPADIPSPPCASCGWPFAPNMITSSVPALAGAPVPLCEACGLPGSPFSAPLLSGHDARAADVLRAMAWVVNIMNATVEEAEAQRNG